MAYVKDTVVDPGVIFSWSNIFAMLQSGNPATIAITIVTALLTTTSKAVDLYTKDPANTESPLTRFIEKMAPHTPKFVQTQFSPLRISALGILAAGLAPVVMSAMGASFAAAMILPAVAAVSFATGSIMLTSPPAQRIQENLKKGFAKVVTHAGGYYGLGYAMIGLMAGGGLNLLAHPIGHIPALITTVVGVSATTVTTFGMATGLLKSSRPYAFLSIGNIVNAISGTVSGNVLGVINSLISATGEARLFQITQNADNLKAAAHTKTIEPTTVEKKPASTSRPPQPGSRPAVRLAPEVRLPKAHAHPEAATTIPTQNTVGPMQKRGRGNDPNL